MNHPLNNMGYQNLRQRLMTVLRKVDEYLDIKIQQEKPMKVWTLKFRWFGDEDAVYVKKTKEELVNILREILDRPEIKPETPVKEIEQYCFEHEIAYFEFEEHTV